MFQLNFLLGTKGRSNEQEGSTNSALSIFTEEMIIPDRNLGVLCFVVQPRFGFGFYAWFMRCRKGD